MKIVNFHFAISKSISQLTLAKKQRFLILKAGSLETSLEAAPVDLKVNHNTPRLQESQILQNSFEILVNFAFLTRILQVCTRIANFENFLQCRTFLTRF